MSSPEHTILWRRLDLPGHDICGLWQSSNGWRLSGTSIFLFEQMPCMLAYEVNINADWQTHLANISGYVGKSAITLTLCPTTNGWWSINGVEIREAAGCVDLDLGFTPATNLIAIRRLSLEIGEQAQAPAAWLSFPEFKLEQLQQQYRRLSDFEYDYASLDVGYAGILQVDQHGAVTDYPHLWQQERLQDSRRVVPR